MCRVMFLSKGLVQIVYSLLVGRSLVSHLVTFRSVHLTLRLEAAAAVAFSLTLFGKLYICQSARAIFALPLPSDHACPPAARARVSIFPDMKWDWKENKRRTELN